MKLSKLLLIIAAIVAVVPSCKKTTTQLEDDTKAIKSYLSANGIQAQESNKVFYQVITEGNHKDNDYHYYHSAGGMPETCVMCKRQRDDQIDYYTKYLS